MKIYLVVALGLLSGCAADVASACQTYVDAYESCTADYTDANGAPAMTIDFGDTFCEDTYGGMTDQATVDILTCSADLYNSTDCADPDAYAAIDESSCG